MNQALTIAHKEILDGLRDLRSIVASLFYALMGPAVVGLVSMATRANAKPDSGASVLTGMMAIFTRFATQNVAEDLRWIVAGETWRAILTFAPFAASLFCINSISSGLQRPASLLTGRILTVGGTYESAGASGSDCADSGDCFILRPHAALGTSWRQRGRCAYRCHYRTR